MSEEQSCIAPNYMLQITLNTVNTLVDMEIIKLQEFKDASDFQKSLQCLQLMTSLINIINDIKETQDYTVKDVGSKIIRKIYTQKFINNMDLDQQSDGMILANYKIFKDLDFNTKIKDKFDKLPTINGQSGGHLDNYRHYDTFSLIFDIFLGLSYLIKITFNAVKKLFSNTTPAAEMIISIVKNSKTHVTKFTSFLLVSGLSNNNAIDFKNTANYIETIKKTKFPSQKDNPLFISMLQMNFVVILLVVSEALITKHTFCNNSTVMGYIDSVYNFTNIGTIFELKNKYEKNTLAICAMTDVVIDVDFVYNFFDKFTRKLEEYENFEHDKETFIENGFKSLKFMIDNSFKVFQMKYPRPILFLIYLLN